MNEKFRNALIKIVKLLNYLAFASSEANTIRDELYCLYDEIAEVAPDTKPTEPTPDAWKLARIAVLEAENTRLREDCVRLTAALNYGESAAETP